MKTKPNEPLISFTNLPDGAFGPALDKALAEIEVCFKKLRTGTDTPTFQNTIGLIESCNARVEAFLLPLMAYRSTRTSQTVLDTIEQYLPKIDELFDELYINKDLYHKLASLEGSPRLSEEQGLLLERYLRSFRENGIDLPDEQRERLMAIANRLQTLKSDFTKNLLQAEEANLLHIEAEDQLRGIPDGLLTRAKERAEAAGKSGWLFSTKNSEYAPVITRAKSAEIRERIYHLRAGLCDDTKNNNLPGCKEILQLRHERAKILGLPSHAHFRFRDRNNTQPAEMLQSLETMALEDIPAVDRELAYLDELSEGDAGIREWDYRYLSVLWQKKQAISLPSFPRQTMVNGMMTLLEKTFGISFSRDPDIETYHDSVTAWRVTIGERLLGVVHLDLFSRDGKRSGNWMGSLRIAGEGSDEIRVNQMVVATNIDEGEENLSWYDASRVLHEIGHALHALLPRFGSSALNTIFNCPMDIVELPSKLMEQFLTSPG